jgi:iron complex outermembrane recepter protein
MRAPALVGPVARWPTRIVCGFAMAVAALAQLTAGPDVARATGEASPAALSQLSIEDLSTIEVSSVSKSPEPLNDAPAAIYVITHDDIIRSGAATIPEMLRLAPNLEVAQINATAYAISARGFNGQIADKLLVLIDGRTVYTPIFAGVYWDMQYVPPEDIERIEVISGPGGTLWGANAVNGVINIITRKSSDTQGGVASISAGNQMGDGYLQYGGRANADTTYRVYIDRLAIGSDQTEGGTSAFDQWHKSQGGFRFDWSPADNLVTVQGDLYGGNEEQLASDGQFISGANVLGHWSHSFDGGSNLQVQTYFDDTRRYVSGDGGGGDGLNSFDLDAQHDFALNGWNKIVWGGGVRADQYEIFGSPGFEFVPNAGKLDYTNVFVEDTISLGGRVKLIPGIKVEGDPYVGIVPLPSVRASWKITDANLLWAAVSRAVRTPTPFDRDVQGGGPPPLLVGGADFASEKLIAYELGYRTQPIPAASLSVSTYYNDYKSLRSEDFTPTFFPITFANFAEGDTYGIEVWGTYRVADWWRLSAAFNIQHENLTFNVPLTPGILASFEAPFVPLLVGESVGFTGDDPTHQASLRSSMDLVHNVTLDAELREVGALPDPAVASYIELNARAGWRVSQSLSLSLAGFNLLHAQHVEFGVGASAVEIGRSFLANARVTF